MKKLILGILLLSFHLGFSQVDPVNIGTRSNDKTGDPLRTAFGKLNANDAYLDTMGVQRLDSLLDAGISSGGGLEVIVATGLNTLVATSETVTEYVDKEMYALYNDGVTNTLSPTLNINGIGAKPIQDPFGATLSANELRANTLYLLVYDATMNFGTGGFRVAGSGDDWTKYMTKEGTLEVDDTFSFRQRGIGAQIEIVSENGSGILIDNYSASTAGVNIIAASSSFESVGFLGDLDNVAGLGRGFYFGDFRAVPKGLQYLGTGYEDTGTDSTLISKGWANSEYWKTSGTTNIGSAQIAIGSSDSFIFSTGGTSAISIFNGQTYLGAGLVSLLIDTSDPTVIFTDSRTIKRGMEYAAAGYVTGDRSLSDKGYVDGKIIEGSATLNFPSTTAVGVSRLTITVTGAADGDPCFVGVPNASMTATGSYSCWVSAANTVTVQFSPKATEDPASGTFKVAVNKP